MTRHHLQSVARPECNTLLTNTCGKTHAVFHVGFSWFWALPHHAESLKMSTVLNNNAVFHIGFEWLWLLHPLTESSKMLAFNTILFSYWLCKGMLVEGNLQLTCS